MPNGYVYGEHVSIVRSSDPEMNKNVVNLVSLFFQALEKMAQENNGTVVCPKTKEVFPYKKIEKVYVM